MNKVGIHLKYIRKSFLPKYLRANAIPSGEGSEKASKSIDTCIRLKNLNLTVFTKCVATLNRLCRECTHNLSIPIRAGNVAVDA